MFSVFLLSYRNTCESLGELEKAVETLACCSCSHSISPSPKLPLVFLKLNRNTVHVFYFLNRYLLIGQAIILVILVLTPYPLQPTNPYFNDKKMTDLTFLSWQEFITDL